MALEKCVECGKKISSKAMQCPNCGYSKAGKSEETLKHVAMFVVVILLLMLGLVAVDSFVGFFGLQAILLVAAILIVLFFVYLAFEKIIKKV